MSATERLRELGLTLPEVAKPLAAYVPAIRVGDQIWTSGQLPLVDGTVRLTGKLGAGVSLAQGTEAARICLLNALAAVAHLAGGLDRITRILRLSVFVASDPGFTDQPKVGNGASELVGEIFGEAGAHVRSAIGVAVLPLNAAVELELTAEVE